jgi:hypothetical protein
MAKRPLRDLIRRKRKKKKATANENENAEKDLGESGKSQVNQNSKEHEIDQVEIIEPASAIVKKEEPEKKKGSQKVRVTRNLARDQAYLKGVRALMLMNLDEDIFIDAFNELRDKYYGNQKPPDEVQEEIKKIVIDIDLN